MSHKAPADAEKIGSGNAPDGTRVAYYEAYRPGTTHPRGGSGILVLVIDDKTGEKLTHSDSVDGLVKAGYKFDPVQKAPVELRQDGPTFEEFVKGGNKPEEYPPAGFAEKPTAGLEAYRKKNPKK